MYISNLALFFIVLLSSIFGACITFFYHFRKRPVAGIMRIDQSNPERDRVVLEMKADPRELVEYKEVIILIDPSADIPPFVKEEESQE